MSKDLQIQMDSTEKIQKLVNTKSSYDGDVLRVPYNPKMWKWETSCDGRCLYLYYQCDIRARIKKVQRRRWFRHDLIVYKGYVTDNPYYKDMFFGEAQSSLDLERLKEDLERKAKLYVWSTLL